MEQKNAGSHQRSGNKLIACPTALTAFPTQPDVGQAQLLIWVTKEGPSTGSSSEARNSVPPVNCWLLAQPCRNDPNPSHSVALQVDKLAGYQADTAPRRYHVTVPIKS